jgi:glyoxylase-like metal-dependent hydrolase (beta-lactamase superfamily II)
MEIKFHGQSCFEISDGGTTVLTDPFLKPNNPIADVTGEEVEATVIAISHGHADHVADLIPVAKRTGAQCVALVELAGWLGEQSADRGDPLVRVGDGGGAQGLVVVRLAEPAALGKRRRQHLLQLRRGLGDDLLRLGEALGVHQPLDRGFQLALVRHARSLDDGRSRVARRRAARRPRCAYSL